ncbi:hypothetical protein H2204_014722 [Knufia peltigerae]|uniref:Major facilitator superfamily (MFS) profile domain-containing protein n=1 Tax=Knufia peltigerae TaxID=1002370 RepID=A0AA38XHV5_9EURO|nr:hypothetical protein H2204_014722 [Knufia peltigerae]
MAGVYLAHYLSSNTFPGASAVDYSLIGGANFAAAMLVAPLVNVVTRHHGTKACMFSGTTFMAGGLIAASFAREFWQLVLTQGIIIGVGVGLFFAQGITAGGTGIGGIIFSSSINPMIESLSRAWALRIMGLGCLVFLLLASLIVRDRNAQVRPRLHTFDVRFCRRRDIWLLLIWEFLYLLGYMTLVSSLPDFSRSLGISQSDSGLTAIMINLSTTSGRILAGWASDHFGRITVALISTFSSGILCLALWIPSESLAATLDFALLVGNVYSTFWISIAPICVELVGLEELSSVLSIAWLNAALPCFGRSEISRDGRDFADR